MIMIQADPYAPLRTKPEWSKLIISHSKYVAELPLKAFLRLPNSSEASSEKTVAVRWSLQALESVKGYQMALHVSTVMLVDCEQCAEKVEYTVDEHCKIAFLKYFQEDESAVQAMDEVLDMNEVTNLWQVVEDTLLLDLPAVSLCERSGCRPIVKRYGDLEEECPFAKLEGFFKKDGKLKGE